MPSGRFIIRASSTTTWPDCQRRWAARHLGSLLKDAGYTMRETSPKVGALVGTAVHSGAAHTLQTKATTGQLAPLKDTQEAAVVSLKAEAQRQEVDMDATTPTMNTAEQQVLRMTEAYQRFTAPKVEPIWVEHRLEAAVSQHLHVVGTADVGQKGTLRDTKTGVRRGAHWPQFGTYILLARAHGLAVNEFLEDYVKRGKVTKPQPPPTVHPYDVRVAEQFAQATFRDIEARVTAFEKSGNPWVFTPNPSSMLCSPKYCPAWGTPFCKVHRPEKETENE